MSQTKPTFGISLAVWNAAATPTPAYLTVAGLLDITPPDLIAEKAIDVTSHDSPSGIREMIPSGVKMWTECTGTFNEVSADVGQLFMIANQNSVQKFKIIKTADSAAPIYFNAVIAEVVNNQHQIIGKTEYKFRLTPTGAAPTS